MELLGKLIILPTISKQISLVIILSLGDSKFLNLSWINTLYITLTYLLTKISGIKPMSRQNIVLLKTGNNIHMFHRFKENGFKHS